MRVRRDSCRYVNGYREFFPPLAESEERDLRQADAREARALISSPRHRGHGGEAPRKPVNNNGIEGLRSAGSLERRLPIG